MDEIKKDNYDASSIQIIKGLDAVRKRPGMYIGSTDSRGLHHLVWEIVDNAIDEVLSNYCNQITITLKANNKIIVEDNGRGIPVDLHSSGSPAVEVIFTKLHAGGKFGAKNSGYKVSSGLHGVGSSVVNALSAYLQVEVYRDNKIYQIEFHKGGKLKSKLTEIGSTTKRGTKVTFIPDKTIFSSIHFDTLIISNRLREHAFLNKKLKIDLIDEVHKVNETYYYENGLVDYLTFLNKDNQFLSQPTFFENSEQSYQYRLAFVWNNNSEQVIESFANNIKTVDGGSHELGFKKALSLALNDFARDNDLLKEREKNFDGQDLREGLIAIISVYIPEDKLEFEGQTKAKLGSNEIGKIIENRFYDFLKIWLVQNKEVANQIINRAIFTRRAREEAKNLKNLKSKIKDQKLANHLLLGKLAVATSTNRKEKELFLVEGDSAGGSAKLGRDRKIQAILPLKGKVLNVAKSSNGKTLMQNTELASLIHAVGTGIGLEFNLEKRNYNKIIIMTDADVDGAHIQSLLLTFFFHYMKGLFATNDPNKGYLYIAQPPLYKISWKDENGFDFEYAWSVEELSELQKEHQNQKTEIQRYKGLGEMNSDQLWETTMNPMTRKLVKVTLEDYERATDIVNRLMGSDAAVRRTWINKHIIFEDDKFFLEHFDDKRSGVDN